MKHIILLFLLFFSHLHSSGQEFKPVPGEKIDFLVSFGIFNAGEASMVTDSSTYILSDRTSYKIDVFGKSVGIFDFFTKVRDNWGVYISSPDLQPKKFYKYLVLPYI